MTRDELRAKLGCTDEWPEVPEGRLLVVGEDGGNPLLVVALLDSRVSIEEAAIDWCKKIFLEDGYVHNDRVYVIESTGRVHNCSIFVDMPNCIGGTPRFFAGQAIEHIREASHD